MIPEHEIKEYCHYGLDSESSAISRSVSNQSSGIDGQFLDSGVCRNDRISYW